MQIKREDTAALEVFESLGMNSKKLIDEYTSRLKSIRIRSDMGDAEIANNPTKDDPLDLNSVAEYVINKAISYPYQDEVEGINFEPFLKFAAVNYLKGSSYYSNFGSKYTSKSMMFGLAHASPKSLQIFDSQNAIPTDEIYIIALELNGLQLEFVPADRITQEMVDHAFKSNTGCFRSIPHDLKTDEMINAMIGENGAMIGFIDKSKITKELAKKAIEVTPWAISYIPLNKVTESMAVLAASKDGMILDEIDQSLLTDNVIRAAIRHCAAAVSIIPDERLNESFARFAVKSHPEIKDQEWFTDFCKEHEFLKKGQKYQESSPGL